MERLLAADVGGSKTRVQILDTQGNVIFESVAAGAASSADDITPLLPLEEMLNAVPEKTSVMAAAVNLGGKNTEQIRCSFQKVFPHIPLKIFRESEGTAAFALGKANNAGIILMAGTGAIAVGQADGKCVIAGGWGANVGDDGSGYDIGLQAIRRTLRALDGTQGLSAMIRHLSGWETPLPKAADAAAFRDRRDAVRERMAPLDRSNIAKLTKTVAEYAEKGDENALEILRYAGEKLAELVVCTAKKLQEPAPGIVVTGGLIHISRFWSAEFEKAIYRSFPDAKLQYVEDGVLLGTRSIVMAMYEEERKGAL